MSETTKDSGKQPRKITFIDHRRPVLETGDYTITVQQAVSLDSTVFSTTRNVTVSGERFALAPSAIQELFPPDGSLGDHSNVLPHAVLTRPTLPWERNPG